MAALAKICFRSFCGESSVLELSKSSYFVKICRTYSDKSKSEEDNEEIPEFRVLQVKPVKKVEEVKKTSWKVTLPPPRSKQMAVDQDWTNVWPGPRMFHPATVPLPVRMGFNTKGPPPSKYGNAELMKIPNFLHLTPPAIKKHCEALKKFCTEWPKELDSDAAMEKHFPVQIVTSDYCHSSPTIRDPMARIVSLKVKVSSLELDEHSRDKLLRLVGSRYDPESDVLTITTDSCPLKKQNYDYAQYLLTALYHEAWTTEEWEKEKTLADMEKYVWVNESSRQTIDDFFKYSNTPTPDTRHYAESVERLFNDGENLGNLTMYKEAAIELLGLPPVDGDLDRAQLSKHTVTEI